jgi:hypothetical protein
MFVLICLLTLSFMLLSGLATTLGARQPINPALAGFIEGCEGKTQPCWRGIMPQVTTLREAQAILENMSYECVSRQHLCTQQETVNKCPSVAWSGYDNLLNGLGLLDCDDLTLGTVIAAIGSPDRIIHFCDGFLDIIWDGFAWVDVDLIRDTRLWFSPTYPVRGISITPTPLDFGPDHPLAGSVYPWRGFMSYQRYLQSQPNPTCVHLE